MPRFMLPEGFYDQPQLAVALRDGDFGPVLRAFRRETGWSQTTLGEHLGMEQCQISHIETGKRTVQALRVAIRVANGLAIPAGRLGFIHGVTVSAAGSTTDRKGSGVDRRDFVERVGALTFGTAAAAAGLDIDRLLALLPQAEPTGTRHVGTADVQAIEAATAAFVRQDFAGGSGIARHAAVDRLHATLPLLGAQMTPEVWSQLHLATARLATQAGWMSFDAEAHDAARRLWLIGLHISRAANLDDQTAFVLYDMAIQAVHLHRTEDALRLIHFGQAPAAGVTVATTSCLAALQGRAHAAQGDAAGCERALGHAVEYFGNIDPAEESWADYFDAAHLACVQGAAYYELALTGRDPRAADRAVLLLRQAVEGFGPDYARSRALTLANLVGAHAVAGNTDTAVSLGHDAIEAVTAQHSRRALNRLQVLHAELQPQHTSPGVAELRERLATTAA